MPNETLNKYFADTSIPADKRRAALDALKSGELDEQQLSNIIQKGYQNKSVESGNIRLGAGADAPGFKAPNVIDKTLTGLGEAAQEEAEIGIGPIERPKRVLQRAGTGALDVVGGLAELGYNASGVSAINPWDQRSLEEKSEAGLKGADKAIQGAFGVVSSPLAASPLAEKAVSLPFEAVKGGLEAGVSAAGIDPKSEYGQTTVNAYMDAIGLGLGLKGMKGKPSVKGAIETYKQIPEMIGELPGKVKEAVVEPLRPSQKFRVTQRRIDELTGLQENNAPIRRVVETAEKQGIDVKKRIAETDLLLDAVDKDGTIRSKPAIEQINVELQPYENIVSKLLKEEGNIINLAKVEKSLKEAVNNSPLKGATKEQAMRKLNKEIEGLKIDATDYKGNPWKEGAGEPHIPLSTIHEAKIDLYTNLDYLRPKSKAVDKTFAKKYKELVEELTKSADIAKINRELSEWYAARNFLEILNGKKVKKGRLGKYFGSTIGAIVGSNLGPLGAVAGAEIGSALTGAQMAKTFGGKTGKGVIPGEILKTAKEGLQKEPLQLPAPE